jgi:hypothetical protein
MTGPLGGGRPSFSAPAAAERISRIEQRLWPGGYKRDVWMLVDAARDRRIFSLLLECFYSQHTCLYSGRIPPALEMVAPYLVQLDYDDEKTRRFLRQAWGNCWGVFLNCNERMETVRRHLRGFLVVHNARRERMIFRYYDPRVLRVYLPTCTPDELRTVFGPITRFSLEDHDPDSLLEFQFEREELIQSAHRLA